MKAQEFRIDMSTREVRQMVQFRTKVAHSQYGEKFQAIQGVKIKETDTHITVENPWRALKSGAQSIRTYRKDKIVSGQRGIMRMNF